MTEKIGPQPHDYEPGIADYCARCGFARYSTTHPGEQRPARPVVERTSAPSVANVPVERIRVHPLNIRKDLGDLRQLAASLATEGVLQPLLLHKTKGTLQIVDGHRRLAAAQLAGLKTVPAMIVDELGDGDVVTRALATGMFKKDISKEERRTAIQQLLDTYGVSRSELARRFGVSPGTIATWAKPPEAQRAGYGGIVNAKQLGELAGEWWQRRGELSADAVALLDAVAALVPERFRPGSEAA